MWYYEGGIRIEPDWNVKLEFPESFRMVFDQNRTRLECKAQTRDALKDSQVIRIEPDWNVKIKGPYSGITITLIRIEPDWNVKVGELITNKKANKLEQNQIGM